MKFWAIFLGVGLASSTLCPNSFTFSEVPGQGARCLGCPDYCSSCSMKKGQSNPACEECEDGYFLKGGKCLRCSGDCRFCSDASTCIEFKDGLYLNHASQTIQECEQGCKDCDFDGKCRQCPEGFFDIGEDETPHCIRHTLTKCARSVEDALGELTCASCVPGFVLLSGRCESCLPNCASCESPHSCEACTAGFAWSSGQNLCLPINQNGCLVQLSEQECMECSPELVLIEGACHTCEVADPNCRICALGPQKSVACSACNSRFGLLDRRCVSCDHGCESCSEGKCLGCLPGFRLHQSTCLPCKDRSCVLCKEDLACSRCQLGWGLDGQGGCAPCPQNCLHCESASLCKTCLAGHLFFADPASKKVECVRQCPQGYEPLPNSSICYRNTLALASSL